MSARAGTAYIDIEGDWSAFSRQVSSQGNKLGSQLGRKLSHAAVSAAKVGAAGVAGAAVFAVKKAADFEGELSTLGSVADATGKQMEAFRKQALKAGADTKFSALEAAQAQTELAKGGLSVAQIMKGGLNSALALAAAGEMNLADAASATVNAMKLFGLRGKQAMKVADGFATAANVTTADVSDFALALTQGGSAAKAAGLSFTETTAALEALAEIGIKGSDAGTSLKAALMQLASPTKKSAELMDELGLKFFDAHGNMKPLVDVAAVLRDKLGGLSREQRLQAASTLVGTDGMRALLALYDAGPEKITKFERGLNKQGTAAEVAKRRQDNLKGSFEQLGGSVETLAINVGTRAIPTIRHLANDLTNLTNKIGPILDRKDLTLGEKFSRIFEVARVDARPWVRKIEHALDEADLPGHLTQAINWAAPKIGEAAAKAAPRAVAAFANAWTGSGVWGRLLIGGWLLKKLGGLGAFRALGAQAGMAFATGMATTAGVGAGASGARGAAATGAAAGAAAGSLGKLKGALGLGKTLAKRFAYIDVVLNLVDSRGNPIVAAINTAHDLTFGIVPKIKYPSADERQKKFIDDMVGRVTKLQGAKDFRGLQQLSSHMRELAKEARDFGKADLGRTWDQLADRASDTARQVNKALGREWVGQIRSNFKALERIPKATMPQIAQVVRNNTQIVKDRLGKDTDAGRKALAANFRLAAQAVKKQMDAGAISTADGTARIRTYLIRALESLGLSRGQAEGRLSRTDKHGNPIGPAQDPTSRTTGGGLGRRQRGGPITTGKPSGDSVPSLLERGEYVLNREAVKSVGVNVLDQINFGLAPRFQQGGSVGIPRVNVRDDLGLVSKIAQRAVDIDRSAAQDVLKRAQAQAAAAAGAAGGETSTTGLVGQVLRALAWARGHGWHGSVTSGFRSRAAQAVLYARYLAGTGNRAAPPGQSNHETGQAIDVTDTEGFARAMAGAPPNARLLRLVPGEPWHFSVTGHQLGGLVGMQGGGIAGGSWFTSPWRRALVGRARSVSAGRLGRLVRHVTRAKTPKLRRQAVAKLLAGVKKAGLPAKLADQLRRHSGDVEKFGDYADRAAALTTTDADGNPVPASVFGKTQVQWLTDQLTALFAWRNALIRAQQIMRERREQIIAAIKVARTRLADVVGQLRTARKHPKANKALIKRLSGVRDALRNRVLPALTGKAGDLKTARGDALSSLTEVQGVGSSMKVMPKLPELGVLGGQILQVQTSIRDLTGQAPKVTDPNTDSERAGLLEQLLREANLRTAVSERQFDVLRNMPPFGGSFKDGGVVPGPVGAPRMILAHGGERVSTPEQQANEPIVHVTVVVQDGAVDRNKIRTEVERVTREQARAGARGLPGRGGGGMR